MYTIVSRQVIICLTAVGENVFFRLSCLPGAHDQKECATGNCSRVPTEYNFSQVSALPYLEVSVFHCLCAAYVCVCVINTFQAGFCWILLA